MASSWTSVGAENRSTSPMTRGRSGPVSMMSTFSGAATRRLISDAGKFSLAQYQRWSSAWRTWPSSARNASRSSAAVAPNASPGCERQLERRRPQVRQQHVDVLGIEARLLGGRLEQVVGVRRDVPVERAGAGDEDGDAHLLPSAGPADLLPGARDGARIAGDDRHVQAPDVDAQLQGRGAHDAQDLARSAGRPRWRVAPRAGSRRDSRAPARWDRGLRAAAPAGSVSSSSTWTRERPNTMVWRPARRKASADRRARPGRARVGRRCGCRGRVGRAPPRASRPTGRRSGR